MPQDHGGGRVWPIGKGIIDLVIEIGERRVRRISETNCFEEAEALVRRALVGWSREHVPLRRSKRFDDKRSWIGRDA